MSNRAALVRAVRGPVILITIGFLFLLDHMDVLPFWRGWPVILIVIGVLRLVERAIGPARQYPPYGPYRQEPPQPPTGSTQI